MPVRLRAALTASALAMLVLIPSISPAANTATISQITVSGGTATVTGTALFPAITTPESVIGDETAGPGQFAAQPVSEAAGLNLTGAEIVPIQGGLRFIWKVSSMPAQV